MSKFLRTVGMIAGVVALAATGVGAFAASASALAATAGSVAQIATVVSIGANIGAELTARKPPRTGSTTDILIGADQPSPQMVGDIYAGGVMVHQVGYGAAINDVPNPYLFMAVVYSVGGPIEAIDTYYSDFEALSFGAPSGGVSEATGYFNDILFQSSQLGERPAASVLAAPASWGTPPDWGSSYGLSGKAAVGWSLLWDSKNGKFSAGAPQLGIRGRGVLRYDPRLDSTYPGGSGAHRWADPRTDKAGHDTAQGTFEYSGGNPGIEGLGYALGSWERDTTDGDSEYQLVFGVGYRMSGIVVEDFVEFANVCDANGWTCNGIVWEGGQPGEKWANLKLILEAGGAEPCFKGGKLGLKINAPRVSLDTITRDDIMPGPVSIAGGQPWRDRINTAIPKCTSPAHKWTEQQSTIELSVPEWITEDGEVKRQEVPFKMVTDFDQAAQLAAYSMYNRREQGPITLPLGSRLRHYKPGDMLTLDAERVAEYGLTEPDVVMIKREVDPVSMTWTCTFMTETAAKHAAALAATGAAPDAITIPTTAELDAVINGTRLTQYGEDFMADEDGEYLTDEDGENLGVD